MGRSCPLCGGSSSGTRSARLSLRLHHSFSHLFIPLRRCGPVSVFCLAGADCPCRGTFARLRFSGIHTLGYRTPFGLFPFFSHFPFCLAQIRESIAEFSFPPPGSARSISHTAAPVALSAPADVGWLQRLLFPWPVCTHGIRVSALSCRDRARRGSSPESCESVRCRG